MIRRRLTFANVLSVIALFVALGGASYAATQLPKNSVGTKQLRNGAVTGAKVKAGTLSASAFAAGQVPAGPQGERGPKGDTGERGLRGESVPQALDVVTRYGPLVTIGNEGNGKSYAACAAGETATGGGYDANGTLVPQTNLRTFALRPSNREEFAGEPLYPAPAAGEPASGFLISMENKNTTGSAFEIRAYALCIKAG